MRKSRLFFIFIIFCSYYLLITANTTIITNPSILRNEIQEESYVSVLPNSTKFKSPAASAKPVVPKPPPMETIAIFVQNSLYASISTQVSQYRQDLNDSGYNTSLYTQSISTHQELKGNLTLWYNTSNLVGAVLIGRLPYAQYYHPASGSFSAETFICDLYLMDLDGSWWDINPADGIYDKHNASGNADIYPEIYIGRIDPTCLSWDTTTNYINSYLARVHNYRIGGVQRQRRALVYIDDDWTGYWGTRWYNDVGLAYSNRTLVDIPTTWTNGTDWSTNRITQNYQWTHICVHSSATAHSFGFGGYGGEGIISSATIRNAPPSFNFYNLFACSGSKWNTPDCLSPTYTFSGSYSLATIGSSKTGSMMDCNYFYGPLAQNATLGESFAQWFSNSLNTGSSAGNYYLEWYYGMNIIGDPFLSIYYDCTVLPPVISSSTHPNSSTWYLNTTPHFNWTIPDDVNGITGYYYSIDQNPTTAPTAATGTYTTINGTIISMPLSEGTWYFHVVAKDGAGNVGTTAGHYMVNIDPTGPTTTIISPIAQDNCSSSSIAITWSATDGGSGYVLSDVWIDTASNIIYTGTALTTIATNLSEGSHIINVTTYDAKGNIGSHQITILVDLTDPIVNITAPINNIIYTENINLIWTASDEQSGYHYAEIRVNDTLIETLFGPIMNTTLFEFGINMYSINVTAYDWSGRSSSDQILILRLFSQQIPGYLLEGLFIAIIAAIFSRLWYYRRRQ